MDNVAKLILTQALQEDWVDERGSLPSGDHTSLACIPNSTTGRARLLCKDAGILAGVEMAKMIFNEIDPTLQFEPGLPDGAAITAGQIAFKVEGEVKSILRAERLVLNFMQRMSGIATLTASFVSRVSGTKAKILDTRKTTPGFRYFEKWAVRLGGGTNHRYGLFDRIMIKDNHIDFCGGISNALMAVKNYQQKNNMNLPVEIESRSIRDVEEILKAGNVNRIMFDNFTPALMKDAVDLVNGQYETEASGRITLENVQLFAETGVGFISVGTITHSYKSLDLSLKAF